MARFVTRIMIFRDAIFVHPKLVAASIYLPLLTGGGKIISFVSSSKLFSDWLVPATNIGTSSDKILLGVFLIRGTRVGKNNSEEVFISFILSCSGISLFGSSTAGLFILVLISGMCSGATTGVSDVMST